MSYAVHVRRASYAIVPTLLCGALLACHETPAPVADSGATPEKVADFKGIAIAPAPSGGRAATPQRASALDAGPCNCAPGDPLCTCFPGAGFYVPRPGAPDGGMTIDIPY